MTQTNYNPDVLTCLANLSNDEVFTPPSLVNNILDLLPKELWSNPDAKFLDPVTKSGVFLREIAKRLMTGLEKKIPNKQKRINHIFENQLYGIAITELTALLSRRSVYCSKTANGTYAVCETFDNEQGNIRYERMQHSWENGKCTQCGASQEVYERGDEAESYAYNFIHTENPTTLFNNTNLALSEAEGKKLKKGQEMKFDVIIGNPPYQLSDGGFGKSATPIYHKFVEQAKKLNPTYLSMIIPARWFGGGKGLDDFRKEMLNDKRVSKIVDFENANECFPGVDIAGGICYFLWQNDYKGECEIVNVVNGNETHSVRSLNEFSTFIRNSNALPIIRKVLSQKEKTMNSVVSSRKPFGIATNIRPQKSGDIILRWQNGEGPYKRSDIVTGIEIIDDWKVISSYVGYDHAGNPGKDGKRRVFSKIDILPPGTICTETYLVIGSFKTKKEATNLTIYMKTRFFRFLVSQFMYSHHITKESYQFVPLQDFSEPWKDEKLYKKYGLTKDEIAFIESMIRPMENV
ncbi:MAG: Eco57I restriction-modification methylase domain-containing protein [Bacteroidetes bacterium]|nr:Eco57I restriction-modification methylase domain-containing protein [Bacteroidota bacterium]